MVCFCFPLVTAWALPFEKWPKRVKRATCEPRAPRLASATFDLVTVSVAFATEGERKRGGVVQEVAAHHALQMGHSKHFLLGMNLQGLLAPPTHLPRHTLHVKTKAFLFLHFNFRLKSKDFAWLRGRFFFFLVTSTNLTSACFKLQMLHLWATRTGQPRQQCAACIS